MAAPSQFTKPILIWAKSKGEDAADTLEAAIASLIDGVVTTGGKQLTAASANGKSFSYSIPSGQDAKSWSAELSLALEIYNALGATDETMAAWLSSRPPSRTVARQGLPVDTQAS